MPSFSAHVVRAPSGSALWTAVVCVIAVFMFSTTAAQASTEGEPNDTFNLSNGPVGVNESSANFYGDISTSNDRDCVKFYTSVPHQQVTSFLADNGTPYDDVRLLITRAGYNYSLDSLDVTAIGSGQISDSLDAPGLYYECISPNFTWTAEEPYWLLLTSNYRFASAPKCKVPAVVGMTLGRARSKVQAARCVLGTAGHKYSKTVGKGRVISQSPAAGTTLAVRSRVAVVVSRGSS
jgi:PASTA domain